VNFREAIGKEFLMTALRTSDFKEASRLATFVNTDHQKRLDEAAGRLHPQENSRKFNDLTAHALEKIVTDWFSLTYRRSEGAFWEAASPSGISGQKEAEVKYNEHR
jgi:hypothetical protein